MPASGMSGSDRIGRWGMIRRRWILSLSELLSFALQLLVKLSTLRDGLFLKFLERRHGDTMW